MEKPKKKRREKLAYGQRLAFSLSETAQLLGVSYITVWRLVKRGKIAILPGLYKITVPKLEIERFLASAKPDNRPARKQRTAAESEAIA